MITQFARVALAFALALAWSGGARTLAQESGKSQDDALDSLLEKLALPGEHPAPKTEQVTKGGKSNKSAQSKARLSQDKTKTAPRSASAQGKNAQGPAGKAAKPSASKPAASDAVAPKDRELDALLEKLGETKDEPAPEERQRGLPQREGPKDTAGPDKPGGGKLAGKDKDIDERLEEYTGRKRKRPRADDERSGPIGEIIKEMREVEQRLGKPDTGDDTQNREKQVVKRIEKLIEEVRRSGSSGAGLRIRLVRRPGTQPGQQDDQTGALARGAPPQKPLKPTSRHANVGGREVWGHLPPELRTVMENSFKEMELNSKAELISRYFLSISKGKLVREE